MEHNGNRQKSALVIVIATKTGAWVSHDLKLFPMTARLLELVTKENRIGLLIVDERSRRPYAETKYSQEWRVIARAAGLPPEICNMDARAGARYRRDSRRCGAHARQDHCQVFARPTRQEPRDSEASDSPWPGNEGHCVNK